MTRIAAALLIVLGVLTLNGGLGRPAFADAKAAKRSAVAVNQPLVVRSSQILGLLLALEALRQVPVPLDPQKG